MGHAGGHVERSRADAETAAVVTAAVARTQVDGGRRAGRGGQGRRRSTHLAELEESVAGDVVADIGELREHLSGGSTQGHPGNTQGGLG